MRVDSLVISAVVEDEFTSTLTDLADSLIDIDRVAAATVEDINADVDIAKAMTKLNTLETQLRTVDGIDTSVGTDSSMSVATPISVNDGGNSGTVVPDGDGGTNRASLRQMVTAARDTFGDAFDPSVLANDPDRATRLTDFLGGQPKDFIDEGAVAEALVDGSLDGDVLQNLRSGDVGEGRSAFRQLNRLGLTSLPTEDGLLDPFTKAIKNFDATALNNLRASLFPLLATFIGALPAAIAGVAALGAAALAVAAALGAVTAVGALGVVIAEDQSLSDIATDLKNEFLDSFAPIAEQLRPTFMRGIDSLEQFFDQLGQRSSILRALTSDVLNLQDAIENYLLGAFENIIGFAAVAADLFGALGNIVDGFSITGALAGILSETIDELIFLGAAIRNMLPFILRLSEGFLRVVGVIFSLIGTLGLVLNQFPFLTKLIGAAIATTLTFASAVLIGSAASRIFSASILRSAYALGVSFVQSAIRAAVNLNTYLVATYGATIGTLAFYAALAAVIGLLTFGIGPILGMASGFSALGGEIKTARKELERFSAVSANGDVGQFTAMNSGRGGSGYVDYTDNSSTTIVAPDKETGGSVSRRHRYDQSIAQQHTS